MSTRAKSLFTAYFILFLDNFGFAVIFPIFPVLLLHPQFAILPHVTQETARNLYLGLLLAAFPFAQFFGAPFFGDIADQFGRKRALSWTICGSILSYFLAGFAILLKSYTLMLICRLLTGFFAGNLVICMAIITSLNFEKKKRGKSLSYVGTGLGISWILAILAGSFFTNPKKLMGLHPSFPFWMVGVLSLFSLVILWTLFRESSVVPQNPRVNIWKGIQHITQVLKHKPLRSLYLMLFFWFLGFFVSIQWIIPLSIEKYHVETTKIMWFLIFYGISWTVASSFLNPLLINYFSLWRMTLWTLFFVSLLYFFAAATDFFPYFAASYVLSAGLAAFTWSNSMSLISMASTLEEQGRSLGIAQSVTSFAQFLGPVFGGVLAGFLLPSLFYICSFLVLISFLILLIYVNQKKSKENY